MGNNAQPSWQGVDDPCKPVSALSALQIRSSDSDKIANDSLILALRADGSAERDRSKACHWPARSAKYPFVSEMEVSIVEINPLEVDVDFALELLEAGFGGEV